MNMGDARGDAVVQSDAQRDAEAHGSGDAQGDAARDVQGMRKGLRKRMCRGMRMRMGIQGYRRECCSWDVDAGVLRYRVRGKCSCAYGRYRCRIQGYTGIKLLRYRGIGV
jgi:hypothetical protein